MDTRAEVTNSSSASTASSSSHSTGSSSREVTTRTIAGLEISLGTGSGITNSSSTSTASSSSTSSHLFHSFWNGGSSTSSSSISPVSLRNPPSDVSTGAIAVRIGPGAGITNSSSTSTASSSSTSSHSLTKLDEEKMRLITEVNELLKEYAGFQKAHPFLVRSPSSKARYDTRPHLLPDQIEKVKSFEELHNIKESVENLKKSLIYLRNASSGISR